MPTHLLRLTLAFLFAIPGLLIASPAAACACGAIASNDAAAQVNRETAIVSKTGNRETIDMRLSMRSVRSDAALIVPTPTPATVSAGDGALFDDYEKISAPRTETRRHWWSRSTDDDGATAGARAPASAAGAADPQVVARVRLGPLDITTLTGDDLDGLRKWLSDNGYQLKPAVISALAPYVAERWSFVAIALTSPTALSGPLDPIRMEFDTDQLVYPMRMSAAATGTQTVDLYVLADHRQDRTDADTARQQVRTLYSGRLADGRHLTTVRTTVTAPQSISSDFVFATAADDSPYRRVVYTDSDVTIAGMMAGPFLLVVGVIVLVVVVAGVAVAVGRRRIDG
ncbi:DUF2330 domain-containing protein [Gordonia sp. (in: high G+C Gram-positive bacteria)]|uniref:DUF2330 domain-containing protein n=1 Tax=Gordonia sp. (in: high G+C Gram-positive bacteria) TaxID=84139 RepID=UPI0019A25D31|nr:DUF2330 domain-containing protein [Gordonia sp. (in: high G+C Gram-positive bacteria)]MBD0022951.1 DUF2330 domain-containing protein [Gordonia sp. (in: high G+C Gram-positive bacteria)]